MGIQLSKQTLFWLKICLGGLKWITRNQLNSYQEGWDALTKLFSQYDFICQPKMIPALFFVVQKSVIPGGTEYTFFNACNLVLFQGCAEWVRPEAMLPGIYHVPIPNTDRVRLFQIKVNDLPL